MKQMMNFNDTRLTNKVELVKEVTKPEDVKEVDFKDSSQKFMEMSSQIESGQYMGWQMTLGEVSKLEVFASEDLSVTVDDFGWIFGSWAEIKSPAAEATTAEAAVQTTAAEATTAEAAVQATTAEASDPAVGEYRMTYLIYSLGRPLFFYKECGRELMKNLTDFGAVIRLVSMGGESNSSMLLVGTKEEMPYYIRGMFARAIAGIRIRQILPEDLENEETLAKLLAGALKVENITSFLFTEYFLCNLPEIEENEEEKKVLTDDSMICELNLSVRAYNTLRRYGITTIGELCSMTDEEVRQLGRLGRLGYERIVQALNEYGLRLGQASQKEEKSEEIVDFSEELDALIGLSAVKEQVKKVIAFAKMKKDIAKRAPMNGQTIPMVLNMSFEGNPGTAKTTVARILAKIFAQKGILKSDEIVEVGRADLVGKYVGHTAAQVKSVFEEAKGKLLFIDEAYSLVDDRGQSFGDEAINSIVQEMENRREDTIVIFAGYPEKMEKFFSRNPGLKSRVPFRINFADYEVEELVAITELEVKKRGFSCSDEAREQIREICEQEIANPEFGNGRFCRNIAENAILNYAVRKYGQKAQEGQAAQANQSGQLAQYGQKAQEGQAAQANQSGQEAQAGQEAQEGQPAQENQTEQTAQVVQLDFLLTEQEFEVPEKQEVKPAKTPIGFRIAG